MGKAGYLPDISGRFNQWTAYSTKCLEMKNYLGAAAALNNMNALLDEDHRVTVNTRQYLDMINEETLYLCNYCKEKKKHIINKGEDDERIEITEEKSEIPHSKIKVFDYTNLLIDSIISNNKTHKAWVCPTCDKVNKLKDTIIIQPEKELPFYYGVVPEPPVRKAGVSNRFGFDDKFRKWFYNYNEELEHALMIYRIEYIQQHGEDMTDLVFKDKGDAG